MRKMTVSRSAGWLQMAAAISRWVVGIAVFMAVSTGGAEGSTLYSEDFTVDPNFTSPEPQNCYWDSSNGWYVANVYDVSTGVGHDYGLSPSFSSVSNSDFHVEFDVNIALQDWGSYPGVSFVDGARPDPLAAAAWQFFFFWADTVPHEFALYDSGGDDFHYYLSGWVSQDTWYHIVVDYDASSETVDVLVTERDTGSVFWQLDDEPFVIREPFDTVAVGQRTNPPRYGDESTIYVDNVLVETDILSQNRFFEGFGGELDGELWETRSGETQPEHCTQPEGPQDNLFCAELVQHDIAEGLIRLQGVVRDSTRMGSEVGTRFMFPPEGTFAASVRSIGHFGNRKYPFRASIKSFFTYTPGEFQSDGFMEHDFELLCDPSSFYVSSGWLSRLQHVFLEKPILRLTTHANPEGFGSDHPVGDYWSVPELAEEFLTLAVTVECIGGCSIQGMREYEANYYVVWDQGFDHLGFTRTFHDSSLAGITARFNVWWLEPQNPLMLGNGETTQEFEVRWFLWNGNSIDPVSAHQLGEQLDGE